VWAQPCPALAVVFWALLLGHARSRHLPAAARRSAVVVAQPSAAAISTGAWFSTLTGGYPGAQPEPGDAGRSWRCSANGFLQLWLTLRSGSRRFEAEPGGLRDSAGRSGATPARVPAA